MRFYVICEQFQYSEFSELAGMCWQFCCCLTGFSHVSTRTFRTLVPMQPKEQDTNLMPYADQHIDDTPYPGGS